tara:strand:- start:17593 stop:18465 length:873 start_codon:yes stop_codon:yes gene_type:complete
MWLNDTDVHRLNGNVFVFDLEWIGDIAEDYKKCKIWDVACVHVVSGSTFSKCVLPELTGENLSAEHGGVDCVPPVTRSMILNSEHGTLRSVIKEWCDWMHETRETSENCILVAHNCFRADALVMMHEFARCGAAVYMQDVLMTDSLLHLRYVLRDEPITSFSLQSLCTEMSLPAPLDPHRAISDCIALSRVLSTCRNLHNCEFISGIAMPFGHVSLTVVVGIGVAGALAFKNTIQIEDLWALKAYLFSKYGDASMQTCTRLLVRIMPNRSAQNCSYTAENIVSALHDICI